MKKIISLIIPVLVSSACFAQDTYGIIRDGVSWSENEYTGSARTIGMGNAVTATGGDIGTIQFNPAGSAVATYSQVSFTPGASVSITKTQGDSKDYMQNEVKRTTGRFIFPNGGFTLKFDTGNSSGLKRFTMGFTASVTNDFNCGIYGSGTNDKSSYASFLADCTNSLDDKSREPEKLEKYEAGDDICSLAYNARVTDRMLDVGGNYYIGTTDNISGMGDIYMGGRVEQGTRHQISGNKMDYVINFGVDISDILYLGANLGITSLIYDRQDAVSEVATDSDLFQTGFKDFTYNYSYRARGNGVYGKFGAIVTPIAGLRIGAAIQTPTSIRITEWFQHSMTHHYGNSLQSAVSPASNWTYRLVTPMLFNVGIAYTFRDIAVISVDYERMNYELMRFKATNFTDSNFFDRTNTDIRGQYAPGATNRIRAGLEVKPIPEFAIRAGYNYAKNLDLKTNVFSLGLGYISSGSFFCDIAAKLTVQPDRVNKVYGDMEMYDDTSGSTVTIPGPVTISGRKLLNIVGTLGWRF